MASQVAPLEIVINPLVNWIWFGFGVLALGTGIAMLPDRAFSFAFAKMPAEAAGAAGALLLLISLGGVTLSAQEGMPTPPAGVDTQTSYYARTEFEKQMQHELVCTCNCGHVNLAECRKDPCGVSHQMRGELAALIDQGKSREEIVQSFVTRYGNEEMLGVPMDRGFRRMAWLFPLSVGAGAAAVLGLIARRWSRKDHEAPAGSASAVRDPELDERLDDELRNLD
jgi:cytochrome c-type biogenesis protein CcmH/NrfF